MSNKANGGEEFGISEYGLWKDALTLTTAYCIPVHPPEEETNPSTVNHSTDLKTTSSCFLYEIVLRSKNMQSFCHQKVGPAAQNQILFPHFSQLRSLFFFFFWLFHYLFIYFLSCQPTFIFATKWRRSSITQSSSAKNKTFHCPNGLGVDTAA